MMALFAAFIAALVVSAIGFKKYVWFISIGYGFSIAAIGILLLCLFGGARRLEMRQDRTYKDDPEYWAYKKKTPIMVPLIPLYSVAKYKWLVA